MRLRDWRIEAEQPGRIVVDRGLLDIDVPAGATLCYARELKSPVEISWEARTILNGGPNDRVSDLNCFWMVQNPLPPRDGRFASYNSMRGYYVGLGGNGNTTTRFRRYTGGSEQPPLLLEASGQLLAPNVWQRIRVISKGGVVEYYRNHERIFHYEDPDPLTRGWFALRTTGSHLQLRNFRIAFSPNLR